MNVNIENVTPIGWNRTDEGELIPFIFKKEIRNERE